MLSKLNQITSTPLASKDNNFEGMLGDLSDELNTVDASSTTDTSLSKSKNKYKGVLKKRRDAIENNTSFEGLIANTTVMQKNELSFKPQIKTAADQKVRMTGVNENRRITPSLITKETQLSSLSETKHPVCGVEKMALKEQPLMVLNRVKTQGDGVKLTTAHLALTLPHVKSNFAGYMWSHSEALSQTQSKQGYGIKFASPHLTMMRSMQDKLISEQGVKNPSPALTLTQLKQRDGAKLASPHLTMVRPMKGKLNLEPNVGLHSGAQNREWAIAPSALKELQSQIFMGRSSGEDSNHLKGSPLTLFEAEPKNVHIGSVNLNPRYSVLQNFPVVSLNYLNYSLSPDLFWQYPKVNSYRVFFAKKYYLFNFENNKVTSFLEECYDRT
ncbi:Uncharacterised protein [Vibrio cholerae]|uniref:hypothetical protein n=1 Tax=Vibrio cholerae TaxID=666 RepID=UPI00157A5165|nr:hypothetical protein [Vibrio cholerae]EGQ8095621.1 hypothetical protein [Vibrio cholerae]EGR0593614.1 hypothetical protein [Vibrio cholerae]EGR1263064.1 hypothetical protein [Vibrio cholerae]EKF9603483.1 hypothetical protein [Vibrio cholerae]ELV5028122.1 hypothetical protein [Vibrio cholerae]